MDPWLCCFFHKYYELASRGCSVLSTKWCLVLLILGYAVVPNFASREETALLRSEIARLVNEWSPDNVSVFTTTDSQQNRDTYFLDSGDKIRFFFEEGALSPEGKLVVPKDQALNKIGHALHILNPAFKAWAESPKIQSALQQLGYKNPLGVQSMYIFKHSKIGGAVSPHKDNTFLATDPLSCVGFWIALEAADKTNGCLWAAPGTHYDPPARRFIRNSGNNGTAFTPEGLIPLEVEEGTLVLIHGNVVHSSEPNTSGRSRQAFTMHYIDQESRWYPDNWMHTAALAPITK